MPHSSTSIGLTYMTGEIEVRISRAWVHFLPEKSKKEEEKKEEGHFNAEMRVRSVIILLGRNAVGHIFYSFFLPPPPMAVWVCHESHNVPRAEFDSTDIATANCLSREGDFNTPAHSWACLIGVCGEDDYCQERERKKGRLFLSANRRESKQIIAASLLCSQQGVGISVGAIKLLYFPN